jgi:hypothetical protein
MDKRLALIVAGSIIGITILCLTVIFPFIYKQLHPSVPPSIMEPTETKLPSVEIQATEKAIAPAINNKTAPKESKPEKPQLVIPKYILDSGQKIRGTSGK